MFFLAETGARIGEVGGLERQDLHGGAAPGVPWSSSATIKGKTGGCEVPISFELYQALMHLPKHPDNPSWIWWGRQGQLTTPTLGKYVRRAFNDAGLEGRLYSAHRLRHTVGTLWAGDLFTLQELLGHSSPATTRIYRHEVAAKLREVHPTANPVAQAGLLAHTGHERRNGKAR